MRPLAASTSYTMLQEPKASVIASMLVIGAARGHRAAAGGRLGSVRVQITHHTVCPVIVIPVRYPAAMGADGPGWVVP